MLNVSDAAVAASSRLARRGIDGDNELAVCRLADPLSCTGESMRANGGLEPGPAPARRQSAGQQRVQYNQRRQRISCNGTGWTCLFAQS